MTDTPHHPHHRPLPADLRLKPGNHRSPDEGMCLMEAVAYFAGEPHSDAPRCACPVLTSHGIRLNDRWNDEERQLLAPLIPKLVGTRSTREVEQRRAYSLVDSAIRSIAPLGLDAVGWNDLGDRLRALTPITNRDEAKVARPLVEAVRDEARKRRAEKWPDAAAADAYAYAADAYAYAADAYAYASDAAYAYAAYADAARRAQARRPIILASVAAFERAIEVQ